MCEDSFLFFFSSGFFFLLSLCLRVLADARSSMVSMIYINTTAHGYDNNKATTIFITGNFRNTQREFIQHPAVGEKIWWNFFVQIYVLSLAHVTKANGKVMAIVHEFPNKKVFEIKWLALPFKC